MKKIMGLVAVFLLIAVIGIGVVFAVTTDTEGPKITQLSFDIEQSIKPGDKVYLNTDMNDAVSGINYVYLWTSILKSNNGTYYGNIDEVNKALKVYFEEDKPYIIIPKTYIAGTYYIRGIELVDKEGNKSYFYTKEQMQYFDEWYNYLLTFHEASMLEKNFDKWLDLKTGNFEPERSNISVEFVVETITEVGEPPVLTSIDIGSSEVNYGDSLQINLEIFDDSNNEMEIYVGLSNGVSMQQHFDLSKGNIVTFEYLPYVHKTLGKISIEYVILEDIYDNMSFYLIDNYNGSLSVDYYKNKCKKCETLKNDLSFEVIDDGSNDSEKPVLNDIKINKTELPIPSFAKIELIASDNKKLSDKAYVTFKNGEKNISTTLYLSDDNIYRGELEINQYVEIGDYKLTDVSISDAAGNGVLYCNYDYKYKDQDLKIDLGFKLTSKFTPNVVTSTIDNEMLQKIRDAKDNDVISIDATTNPIIPKSVFEQIQGTNKTIHIESNGIEWIFNGNDINLLKDINTSLDIYYDYNYDELDSSKYLEKALFLKFADNGELPGVATVRIKVDYALRNYIGENVYIYFYDKNSDKMFTYILDDAIELNNNGWFEFKINHNSTYILTNKKVDSTYTKEDKQIISINQKNDIDNNQPNNIKLSIIFIFAFVLIIIVGSILVCKNKHKKNKVKELSNQ